MKWTQRDGSTIEVSDMDDNHLTNTIAILTKKMSKQTLLNVILKGIHTFGEEAIREITLNGDMAQEFNDLNDEPNYYDDYYDN